MRAQVFLALLALFLPIILSGCSSPSGPWIERDASALSGPESAQLADAMAARDLLFETLMEKLVAAIGEGGPVSAINVCKTVAPDSAVQAGKVHGVSIGRTSYKLRNTDNLPPAWAVPFVEARRASPVVLRDESSGTLAALFPIKLKSECLQCHGAAEDIQPDVREAIQKAYPGDSATGFKEGELRGWFHVTVPPAAQS